MTDFEKEDTGKLLKRLKKSFAWFINVTKIRPLVVFCLILYSTNTILFCLILFETQLTDSRLKVTLTLPFFLFPSIKSNKHCEK